MNTTTAGVLNVAHALITICCNGGLPYVDLHFWPREGASFYPVDPTEWIAEETNLLDLNASVEIQRKIALEGYLNLISCDAYNISFESENYEKLFAKRNGSLACKCPSDYSGNACELTRGERLTGRPNHSFKIFLFLAIIPLSFALFAAVGGFLCKICCCDCFGWSWDCSCKNLDDLCDEEDQMWDSEQGLFGNINEHYKNTSLSSDGHPTHSSETDENSKFLPVAITSASACHYDKVPDIESMPAPHYSPPPPYKSRRSSTTQQRHALPASSDAATQTLV